jgi:hypothetical protein
MPQWLSIIGGTVAGVVIVAAAISFAIWPYVQARPAKKRFVDRGDFTDNSGNWSSGDSGHGGGWGEASGHGGGSDSFGH